MGYVWAAWDTLRAEVLERIDPAAATDDVERDLSELLHEQIQRKMDPFAPVQVHHAVCERESRQAPPAQPPTYDIAFALRENRRVMWPLEAKVLRTAGDVGDYVKTFRQRFLTHVYAPFSSHASMLGYLFSGAPEDAFARVSAGIPCTLHHHPSFRRRQHKLSRHRRSVPTGKPYPKTFVCHHLMLEVSTAPDGAKRRLSTRIGHRSNPNKTKRNR